MGIAEREEEEIRRSAVEAARRPQVVTADFAKLARYADPPQDTAFPLEYSFHLLHQNCMDLTVLDFGCGVGEDAIPLAKSGVDVIGLDISPELIEHARRRAQAYGVNARFIVGSAYQTGLPSASIDIVFAIAIFHHLDLPVVKEELCRILKPNGILIVQEPVRDSKWMGSLRSLVPAGEISAFEKPLTRRELDMLSEGFVCDSVRRFRLPFVAIAERLSPSLTRLAYRMDRPLLRSFTSLQHFATVEVRRLTRSIP